MKLRSFSAILEWNTIPLFLAKNRERAVSGEKMKGLSSQLGAKLRPTGDDSSALGKLLVATNGSQRANLGIRRAAQLGMQHNAGLHVQQIVNPETRLPEGEGCLQALEQVIKDAVNLNCLTVDVGVCPYPDYFIDDETGRASTLLDIASKTAAILIVLGIHRRDKIRPLLGTLTERLLREGDVPLLIAVNDPPAAYNKVIVAVDFSPLSEQALSMALSIAPDAELVLTHAVGATTDGVFVADGAMEKAVTEAEVKLGALWEQVVKPVGGTMPPVSLHVKQGPPQKILRQAIAIEQPDLVVMGTRGRSAIVSTVLGSVAQNIIADPQSDVLVVNFKRTEK